MFISAKTLLSLLKQSQLHAVQQFDKDCLHLCLYSEQKIKLWCTSHPESFFFFFGLCVCI